MPRAERLHHLHHRVAAYKTQSIWEKYQRNIRNFEFDYQLGLQSTYSIHSGHASLLHDICNSQYEKTMLDKNRNLSNVSSLLQGLSMTHEAHALPQYMRPSAVGYELASVIRDLRCGHYKAVSIKRMSVRSCEVCHCGCVLCSVH